jgi:hypothetical protein
MVHWRELMSAADATAAAVSGRERRVAHLSKTGTLRDSPWGMAVKDYALGVTVLASSITSHC